MKFKHLSLSIALDYQVEYTALSLPYYGFCRCSDSDDSVRHLSTAIDKFKYHVLCCGMTVGGVLAFREHQFRDVIMEIILLYTIVHHQLVPL